MIDTVILPPMKPAAFKAAMPGVSAPFGFFDPLNFTDGQSIGEIKRLRESELTHGASRAQKSLFSDVRCCASVCAQRVGHGLASGQTAERVFCCA